MLISMNPVLLIISVVLLVAAIGYSVFYTIKFVKDRKDNTIDKTKILHFSISAAAAGLSLMGINFGRAVLHSWNMEAMHVIAIIFGSLFFGSAALIFFNTFVLRYYKKIPELEERIAKWNSRIMFITIPVMLVFILIMLEGLAPYVHYPLTNGVTFFGDNGFASLTTWDNPGSGNGLHLQWYGVIIVSGAVLVYFISDHKLYKVYKKHGLLDTCFLIAFPMGILGARLWFCLVLRPDYFLVHPAAIFTEINQGGLAIQGGALLGIISGVTYMVIFKRFVKIRQCIDFVVPTILIAQAIGRWGNFFNHEVYGNIVNTADMWFIPTFIKNQMLVDFADPTQMYIPLFFIECIVNICGYFIITRLVGKLLRKVWNFPDGTIGACYLIWYGIVRIIMEPMRYGESGQQDQFTQSWITAFVFVGVGLLIIGGLCLYEYVILPKIKAKKTAE